VLDRGGRYAESEGLLRRALGIFEKSRESHRPDLENYLSKLGEVLVNQGKREEAAKVYADVIDLRSDRLGKNHPRTVAAREALQQLAASTH
jgi:tetratricopeptide (TPR) repeat protein